MFEALGKFAYRFRWIVIGIWVVLFAASVWVTPRLGAVLQGSFSNPNAPAQQAGAVIQEKFKQGPTTVLVLFTSPTYDATSTEFQALEKQALDKLSAAKIPYLGGIQTYASTGSSVLLAQNGKSSVAVLNFTAPLQTIQKEVDSIRDALKGAELRAYVTGEPAVNADLTSSSFSDLRKVEMYALPVALVALLFVFGSLVSAALPVLTGGLAVTVTLGGMYLIGRATSMSIFAMNTCSLLGLAVAIDYALFMVSRFREELHRGASVQEATVVTTARAGRSVFFSGLAVMVGVVGLLFFPSPGLRSIGIGGALVVFFSVVATVTFMPALLAVLGHRVNSVPLMKLRAAQDGRLWKRWSSVVLERSWVSILVAIILIAAVAAPAATMKTAMTSAATLPRAAESRQGLEILDQEFDRNALSPISVLVTWEGGQTIDVSRAAALFAYGQQISTQQGVASVLSPFTVGGFGGDIAGLATLWPTFQKLLNDPDNFTAPAGGLTVGSQTVTADQLNQFKQLVKSTVAPGAALFQVVSKDPPSAKASQDLVKRLLKAGAPSGYQVRIAGESAYNNDFFSELGTYFPWVVAWVVVISLVVFVLLLRSLLLPVVTVILNLLTIGMSYGILVLLFQGTAFEKALRFTSIGTIDAVIPVVLLCLLFGITMDYAVFMLTRMHERWERCGDNREAVMTGIVRTGRIIVSAALLVVIVTGAFAFTSIAETKMLGLGVAVAVIVDTLFIRLTLLPSLMSYLGRANWWWPERRRSAEGAPGAAPSPRRIFPSVRLSRAGRRLTSSR